MRLGNLRHVLSVARLPQYQLAVELRISESVFSRKISGRREFSATERAKIVEILAKFGVSVDAAWLFAELIPPRPSPAALAGTAAAADGAAGRGRPP
jgi:transcriptional regulator with XRE-family HTH domain